MYFSATNLVLTKKCNLACPYCFVNKEDLTMSDETIRNSIHFLTNGAIKNNDSAIRIGFFGGEPTLAFPQMEYAYNYTIAYLEKLRVETGIIIKPEFSFTTNGMIFDEKFENFLLKILQTQSYCNVQLSFDGPPEIETKCRPSRDINQQSGLIMEENLTKIIRFCKDHGLSIKDNFCIHCVVTTETLPHLAETYHYFHQLGFPVWHLLLPEEDWSEQDGKVYNEQLYQIEEFAKKNDPTLLMYSTNCVVHGPTTGPTCLAGISFCGIEPNGDIYPCHRLAEFDDSSCLGNVNDNPWHIDEEKKQLFEELDKKEFLGNQDCAHCSANGNGCYVCVAANMQSNLLPNLCFPKVCNLYQTQVDFNKRIEQYLIENHYKENTVNLQNLVNTDGNTNVIDGKFLELFEQLVNGIVANNDVVAQGFDELQNQIDTLREHQKDIINLLVAVLTNIHGANNEISSN